MRLFALVTLLLATAAGAAPVITRVDPSAGFTFAPTRVVIHGTDLAAETVACPIPPPGGTGQGTCPVEVFFGNDEAYVVFATPTEIHAFTNPFAGGQPRDPGTVDVRVLIEGKGEATLADGFRFTNSPDPDPLNSGWVLVPLTTAREVRGANGSVWQTQLRVFNNSAWPLEPDGPLCNPVILAPCVQQVLDPNETATLDLYPGSIEGTDGAFLWMPNPLLRTAVHMSLRVRDISENALSWGTSVPVVWPEQFATRQVIIDIPTDARYRGMLRIYSSGSAPQTVEYRVFRENQQAPVLEGTVLLHGIVHPLPDPMPDHPAYAQIDLLTPQVRAAGERVWVEVYNMGDNVSPPPPSVWAFVSVTNNDTQQITTMLPD
jgi:hypothetical protein